MALDLLSTASGLNPIGMGLNLVGGIANIFGASGQAKEAKRQLESQKLFGMQQRNKFDAGFNDLISNAKRLPTYQADITRFAKAENAAEMAKRMVSGGARVAGEDIQRENARQTTANTLASAQRGATSGMDLMTAALFAQNQENQQMRDIDIQSGQTRQSLEQQAQQNYLSSLGQTAAAQAQQAGMQFQSESQRANNVLNAQQRMFEGGMNLDQNLFAQEQAQAGAVANANAAIWSGIGGLAGGVGKGLMDLNSQNQQMGLLRSIYGAGNKNAYQSGTIQERMGTPSPMQLPNTFGAINMPKLR
jgi:hypothetical protein